MGCFSIKFMDLYFYSWYVITYYNKESFIRPAKTHAFRVTLTHFGSFLALTVC